MTTPFGPCGTFGFTENETTVTRLSCRTFAVNEIRLQLYALAGGSKPIGRWCWQRASVLNPSIATAEPEPILEVHQDEGWRLHQPATLRQGGFHESGMWPFLRQI